MALTYGPLATAQPEGFSPQLLGNIDEGRQLSGADVARAEAKHTQLYHRVREFFGEYDLCSPRQPGAPFPVEWRYPTEVGASRPRTTWMDGVGVPHLDHRVPGAVGACRVHAGGVAVGLQIVGPHRATWRCCGPATRLSRSPGTARGTRSCRKQAERRIGHRLHSPCELPHMVRRSGLIMSRNGAQHGRVRTEDFLQPCLLLVAP